MIRFHDFIDAIRVGLRATREHLHTIRWLRSGGCPDDLPSF